jgi:hypothetical protein
MPRKPWCRHGVGKLIAARCLVVAGDDWPRLGDRPVSSASALRCSIAFAGTSMDDRLVRHFTIFGGTVQNWMLVTLAIIAVGIILSWCFNR